jgi:ATP-dependent DNA ligase
MERNLVLSDFTKVPGGLINGEWKFPVVLTVNNKTKKEKIWNIYVCANVPIILEWVLGTVDLPADIEAKVYSRYKYIDSKTETKSEPKLFKDGKVKRNTIQQALADANNKWRKQSNKSADDERKIIRPQLLKEFNLETIESIKRRFKPVGDVYVSYKYDGVRCVASAGDDGVIITSRETNEYDVPHIKEALMPFFELYPELVLDGELYLHETHQSIISGLVRSGKKTKLTEEQQQMRSSLVYCVFDIIDPSDLSISFTKRYESLLKCLEESTHIQIVSVLKTKLEDLCKVVNNNNNNNMEYPIENTVAWKLMKQANILGMEGIVIRIGDGDYQESNNGYHSLNVLKLKPALDAEFIVVAFKDGEAKNKGAIQWECEVPTNLTDGQAGARFDVVPAMPYEERQRLFKLLSENPDIFENEYKGKLMNVTFAAWSTHGLPVQVRANGIRETF